MHLNPVACPSPPPARAHGSPPNPERLVHYYFDDGGELMACYDPLNGPPDAFRPLPDLGILHDQQEAA
jgi:hypothetical protein